MTRYYFDAIDGFNTIDDQGEELPNIEAARVAAGRVASQLIPNRIGDIWAGTPFKVVIRTARGVVGAIIVTADEDMAEPEPH